MNSAHSLFPISTCDRTDDVLQVPSCTSGKKHVITNFEFASGTEDHFPPTSVELCHTSEDLVLKMTAYGGQQQNQYTECNSKMWNQEVMEMFIAPSTPGKDPKTYLEIEVTPQNALFVARINNPDGTGANNQSTMVDCHKSGIRRETYRKEGVWHSKLHVPWKLIGKSEDNTYTGNFFRVAMQDTADPHADCTPQTCMYGGWRSTHSDPPAFHHPKYFGTLKLV